MDDRVREAFEAAQDSNLIGVKCLIEEGIIPANVTDREGWTLAHVAAKNSDLTTFRYVVEKDPSMLRKYGKDHKAAFIKFAIERGSLRIVKYLVETWYAETFFEDDALPGYDTALIWAAELDRIDILDYLIEKGNIDVNNPADRAITLFSSAAESCNREVIKFLIEEKHMKVASFEENIKLNMRTLIRKCNLPFLKFILDELKMKMNIDQQDDSGYTLAHEAILLDNAHILDYLVEQKKVNLNIGSADTGETPLFYTVRGSESLTEYLLEHGADINWRNHKGNTPLHCASADSICISLVDQGADVNLTNNDGDTPLHLAIKSDRADWPRYHSCKYLIERGAEVNRTNNAGQTPLHLAVANEASVNSYEVCKQLVEHGANIDQKNMNGETAVHLAAARKDLNILEYLVGEKRADIDVVDKNGRTPLHVSAAKGRERVCKYLVEQGADINRGDNNGWTPLHFAASNERYGVCEYLVQHAADTRVKNNAGKSPLEVTSDSRIIECIKNASNSSGVGRSRRNVPPALRTSFWMNREPSEYTRRRMTGAAELGEKSEALNQRLLSTSLGSVHVFQFQNFLSLAGLLIRNRRMPAYSPQVSRFSDGVPSERMDPVAEVAVTRLPRLDGRKD